MSEELKPVRCGCGGEAMLYVDLKYFSIICKKCGIATRDFLSEAEAVEAWNRAMSGHVIVYGDPDAPKSKTVG